MKNFEGSRFVILLLALTILIKVGGCGFMWQIEGGWNETYVENNLQKARSFSTARLIKELRNNQFYSNFGDSWWLGSSSARKSKFLLALEVLKQRRELQVYDTFVSILLENPDPDVHYSIIGVLQDYYENNAHVAQVLLEEYRATSEWRLRHYILAIFLIRKVPDQLFQRLLEVELTELSSNESKISFGKGKRMALLYSILGRYEEAIQLSTQLLIRAVEEHDAPQIPDAILILANAYEAAEKYKEALDKLRFLQGDSKSVSPHLKERMLALELAKKGELPQAITHFRSAYQTYPNPHHFDRPAALRRLNTLERRAGLTESEDETRP